MSFKITEEYVQAAIELEQAGYEWTPGPGDWILDKDDQSIGLLTTPVQKQWLIRRLNTHLPTFVQVDEMLEAQGVTCDKDDVQINFNAADFSHTIDATEYNKDPGLSRLRVLGLVIAKHVG
ncbi:hypothetical protein OAU50_07410 [Planctomycetota bacterium]|nr:hypothetical protein [Planctomycetota bacterium]